MRVPVEPVAPPRRDPAAGPGNPRPACGCARRCRRGWTPAARTGPPPAALAVATAMFTSPIIRPGGHDAPRASVVPRRAGCGQNALVPVGSPKLGRCCDVYVVNPPKTASGACEPLAPASRARHATRPRAASAHGSTTMLAALLIALLAGCQHGLGPERQPAAPGPARRLSRPRQRAAAAGAQLHGRAAPARSPTSSWPIAPTPATAPPNWPMRPVPRPSRRSRPRHRHAPPAAPSTAAARAGRRAGDRPSLRADRSDHRHRPWQAAPADAPPRAAGTRSGRPGNAGPGGWARRSPCDAGSGGARCAGRCRASPIRLSRVGDSSGRPARPRRWSDRTPLNRPSAAAGRSPLGSIVARVPVAAAAKRLDRWCRGPARPGAGAGPHGGRGAADRRPVQPDRARGSSRRGPSPRA